MSVPIAIYYECGHWKVDLTGRKYPRRGGQCRNCRILQRGRFGRTIKRKIDPSLGKDSPDGTTTDWTNVSVDNPAGL